MVNNVVIQISPKKSNIFLWYNFHQILWFLLQNIWWIHGWKKREDNFTKFCENFRDSPNLVNQYVINKSPKKMKFFFVMYISPHLVIFYSNYLVIFIVSKKLEKKSQNFVRMLVINKFLWRADWWKSFKIWCK